LGGFFLDKINYLNDSKNEKYNYYISKYNQIMKNNKNQKIIESYNSFCEEPIENQIILYETFHGKSMTDNPYAIFKSLINNEKYQDYTHVWVINNDTKENDVFRHYKNVIFVKVHSKEYIKYLAKAKYLINNTSFPPYFCKRKEQVYLNTWHGTPLKTLGTDMNGPIDQLKNIQRNFIHADYIISPNEFTTEKLINTHNLKGIYEGKVLEVGYPRIDLIQNTKKTDILNKIRNYINIDTTKKIALYAPTWRGNVGKEIDIKEEVKQIIFNMKEHLDESFQLVLKVHPLLYKFFKNDKELSNMFIPDSIDVNEFLSIVDLLITDYSSIFFDFYIRDKPIILYVYDKDEYLSERGTYIDFEDLNCYIANDKYQLNQYISDINKLYGCKKEEFIDKQDGKVTEKVIKHLFENELSSEVKSFRNKKENVLVYLDEFTNKSFSKKVDFINNYIDRNKYNVMVLIKSSLNYEEELEVKKLKNIHMFYRFGNLNVKKEAWIEYMIAMDIGYLRNDKYLLQQVSFNEIKRLIGDFEINYIYNLSNNSFWQIILGFYPYTKKDKVQLLDVNKLESINNNNNNYYHSFVKKFDKYISFDIESLIINKEIEDIKIKFININSFEDKSKEEIEIIQETNTMLPIGEVSGNKQYILLKDFTLNDEYIFIDCSNTSKDELLDFYHLINKNPSLAMYKRIIYGLEINNLDPEFLEIINDKDYILPQLKNNLDMINVMKKSHYVFILEDFKYSVDKIYHLVKSEINIFVMDKYNLLNLMFNDYICIHEWCTFLPLITKYNINGVALKDDIKEEVFDEQVE
jgi:CDP-glycerol glycerophosphotransferase